eukprot:jgi/Tetstr1/441750/TSEL_029971.t1
MSDFEFDLFVIGGGSGGVRAARIAAGHGARVGIAEEYRYGGTCVIRGCVPKKLFVYASRFSEEFEDAAGFGWDVGASSFNWERLIDAKDREIARLETVYRRNLERSGVEMFDSRAVLEDEHTVHILSDDRRVRAKTILIATGATPNVDADLPGGEHVITSNEAFHLADFPKRVVVAGGGYIAVEFAGIFAGLGAETTLIYRGEEILRGFDDDLRKALHEEMEKKGIRVLCGDVFTSIEKREGGDYSRTNVPSIYAVGDVTDRVNLTPVAIREGHAFADTLFGGNTWSADHSMIPTAVFSQPEIGTVGMTQAEAVAKHGTVDVYRAHFRPMKHTLSGRDEKMLMKLLVDPASDKVLGVHILGHDAGELAQVLGVAMRMGATKADFDATMAVHPTAAEELVTMREPTERVTA